MQYAEKNFTYENKGNNNGFHGYGGERGSTGMSSISTGGGCTCNES
jgi:hypothetical protein